MEKINISNIVANWQNVETVEEIDKLLSEIVSTFHYMQEYLNLYDADIVKKLVYIKGKLYRKRKTITHARKERMRYKPANIADEHNV